MASRQKNTVPQLPLPGYANHLVTFNSTYLTDVCNLINEWSCSRVILVVSKSLDANTDKVHNLESALGEKFVGKKAGVGAHSPYADVLAIARLMHERDADAVVCIGSSSYSDATKNARLLHATFPADQLVYETMEMLIDQSSGRTRPGVLQKPKTKIILIPSSLSVSEYNPISSATNRNGKKQHFNTMDFVAGAADMVLLDPEIAATAPPESLWLPSGARAVDHAVESLCASSTQPEGIEAAKRSLKALLEGLTTYKERLDAAKNRTQDEDMLKGISECQAGARESLMGMLCYGSKLGPSHAIGHQLGSVGKVAHGHTSCVCLAPTLRYESLHLENPHFSVEGQRAVVEIFNETLGWEETNAGDAVEKFYKKLGLPTRLSEVGVTSDEALQKIAENTMTDIWGGGETQIDDPKEILKILQTVR
jgi:alcohol dehydrogenase class IV